MISLKNISIGFHALELLNDVSLKISSGERIGLIGENGSGKSTLLKILVGLMEPDQGRIERKGSIGYLAQEPLVIGMDEHSGGERSRQALEDTFAVKHDIYVLDEPTNNLDIDALAWLESTIRASKAAFIIVSHDRAFLDATVTKIIEIDSFFKKLRSYGGNYTYFKETKERELASEVKAVLDHEKKVKDMTHSIGEKKLWAKTGHTAPNTTDNDKFLAGVMMDRSTHIFSIAKNLERRLKKIHEEAPDKRHIEKPLDFEFLPIERSGTVVFEVRDITKTFSPTVTIGPLSAHIEYGDTVAITGKNGTGKSTCIEMLTGALTPDSGTILRAQNLHIGYLRQKPLIEDQTVFESMPHSKRDEITRTRHILSRFGFTDEQITKPIALLSPGERSRLILAQLVVMAPNCIILDEPSNHLDIPALEALERALLTFTGTVIVISHDRYFLERIKPTKVIEMSPKR